MVYSADSIPIHNDVCQIIPIQTDEPTHKLQFRLTSIVHVGVC